MTTRKILDNLISFPTVSRDENLSLIYWARDFLTRLGASVEVIEGFEKGKASLWARLGPKTDGGIVFAGHVDVVPVDDQSWTTAPFVLMEESGKLYGRGTCDMKGFVASVLSLAERVDILKLVKPIYIALTHNEEVNMEGARLLSSFICENNIKPDWVWVGEPTELEVVSAHKGSGKIQTIVNGVSAHSSLPQNGLNANELGVYVCNWILDKDKSFSQKPIYGSPFDPPYTTLNLGILSGGTAPNVIPDKCTIIWQYRLHPGDDLKALFKEHEEMLDAKIRPLMTRFSQASVITTPLINIPPFTNRKDCIATSYLSSRTGDGTPKVVSYATEAGYYQSFCDSVVICGPGSITKAHQPDEYVPISDLDKCDKLLDACVNDFLMCKE